MSSLPHAVHTVFSTLGVWTGLALLVLVHEAAHALVARAMGARVLRIVLGVGPRLLTFPLFGIPVTWRLIPIIGFAEVTSAAADPPTVAGAPDASEVDHNADTVSEVSASAVRVPPTAAPTTDAPADDPNAPATPLGGLSAARRIPVVLAGPLASLAFGLLMLWSVVVTMPPRAQWAHPGRTVHRVNVATVETAKEMVKSQAATIRHSVAHRFRGVPPATAGSLRSEEMHAAARHRPDHGAFADEAIFRPGRIRYALLWAALVSLLLGWTNLVPVPPLDGGVFAVAVVELIRGRPLTRRMWDRITNVGLTVVLAFILLTC